MIGGSIIGADRRCSDLSFRAACLRGVTVEGLSRYEAPVVSVCDCWPLPACRERIAWSQAIADAQQYTMSLGKDDQSSASSNLDRARIKDEDSLLQPPNGEWTGTIQSRLGFVGHRARGTLPGASTMDRAVASRGLHRVSKSRWPHRTRRRREARTTDGAPSGNQ